jgi:hypothetical protein
LDDGELEQGEVNKKKKEEQDLTVVLTHTCDSSIWVAETGGLLVLGQSSINSKTLTQKSKDCCVKWLMLVTLAAWEAEIGRISVQGQHG